MLTVYAHVAQSRTTGSGYYVCLLIDNGRTIRTVGYSTWKDAIAVLGKLETQSYRLHVRIMRAIL